MTPPNLFVQYPTIPDAPDDPGDDQPLMQTNAASDNSISNVDHIGYNAANGGLHRQVNMFNQASPIRYGDTLLYSNISAGFSNLWLKNSNQDVPLTTFGSLATTQGYTSLFGGLLIQWGIGTTTGNNTTIPFNTSFTTNGVASNAFVVVCTPQGSTSGLFNASAYTSTNFNFNKAGSANFSFSWIAIGQKT